ncbi:glycosyltransferase family 2 protein [Actinoplanes sp. DH11]|uniref:glycosyltransferase family 2 protein n=1 Tax=Actinoplanes sp. DH11 TaxID=2857011 RepID=UPI001E4EE84E|nr:glycosyltransferase family 2 protein [Actinoplanes sp. DH11]
MDSKPEAVTPETVAVVVVTYNSERLLPDLIASLGPGLAGVDWSLTVADNASADDSVGAVRRLAPHATVVEMGRNAGYAAGINAAVAKAGPFTAVLVLNPDVRLTPGCVRTLLEVLRKPGTGIAVPLLTDGDGELIHTMRREPAARRVLGDAVLGAVRAGRYPAIGEMVTDERLYTAETVTDWAEGSTVLISAECWNAVGPWDESFFLYSEETDFALRARDAGYATRFTPAAKAVHLEGDSKVSPGLWTLLTLNKVRLYGRRHGPVPAAGFWAALLLREASRAALGKEPSKMAAGALISPARLREAPGPHTVHRTKQ